MLRTEGQTGWRPPWPLRPPNKGVNKPGAGRFEGAAPGLSGQRRVEAPLRGHGDNVSAIALLTYDATYRLSISSY